MFFDIAYQFNNRGQDSTKITPRQSSEKKEKPRQL